MVLGVFGQDMAYFLSENFAEVHPIYYLTVITSLSILLYVSSLVLNFIFYKRQNMKWGKISPFISMLFIIGMFTTYWALFVVAMWWG